ncbi:MAG: hypothetical protein ACFE91_09185 [Promethearchaeota archaeon]
MKIKEEGCDCLHPEIKEKHPSGCSLNQVIKCHGDQPLSELFKHIELKDKGG